MTASGNPTLVVRDLQVLRGQKAILKGVNLNANVGEVCAVMGISGAGKTTVLRAIAALQSFNAGSISIDGVSLTPGAVPPESQLKELRRRIGVVFQSNALFEHLSVLDNVTLAPVHGLKWTRERANETAQKLLASLGVEHRAGAYPRELSGGEAQRVAIARALGPRPAHAAHGRTHLRARPGASRRTRGTAEIACGRGAWIAARDT